MKLKVFIRTYIIKIMKPLTKILQFKQTLEQLIHVTHKEAPNKVKYPLMNQQQL